jgi:UDP-N-acetylglucosamine 2-epimerase (non-hydrolysing)
MKEKMKIHLIAAARPNFMKIAPIYHCLNKESWANPIIVHTGQHYDLNMSDVFFKDLKLPEPHIHLGIGGGSHADQTGKVMIAYEKVLVDEKPDLVIVVGDVNATMACTITTAKIDYGNQNQRPLIAHLEAGLRSFDRSMPEEINRIVTDSLADILWTPSPDGDENLLKEGVVSEKIERVGNIMLDSFEMLRQRIDDQETYKEIGLKPKEYAVVTLHRPSNVDDADNLKTLCKGMIEVAEIIKLCFPVHPRTKKKLMHFGYYDMLSKSENIILTEPLNYIRFMNLVVNSRLAITDSGGIQEETTYLGIPCLTMRENTERPITITQGTNKLCSAGDLLNDVNDAMKRSLSSINIPEMWDGNTAARVVDSIKKFTE